MALEPNPQTPLRRSKRGQPLLSTAHLQLPNLLDASSDHPINVRPTQNEDLYDDERESEDLDLDALETRCYARFVRSEATAIGGHPKVDGKTRQLLTKHIHTFSDIQEENVIKHSFNVGDTVQVKTLSKEPSLAVIVAIWDIARHNIPDGKGLRVMVHWFVRPSELPAIRARREHAKDEIYYSLTSSATLPPSNIISHCIISSAQTQPPSSDKGRQGTRPKAIKDDIRPQFTCRLAVDPRRGLFYNLDWENFREECLFRSKNAHGISESSQAWNVSVAEEGPSRSPRKKARLEGPSDNAGSSLSHVVEVDESEAGNSSMEAAEVQAIVSDSEDGSSVVNDFPEVANEDEEEGTAGENESEHTSIPTTPSRKRKRATATPRTPRTPRRAALTPRKSRIQRADVSTLAQPTPHSKAALRKRKRTALAVRPPPPTDSGFNLHLDAQLGPHASKDPWLRAMHVLHVAARPEALPCRDEEYKRVLRAVENLLEEGSGGCVYISGVPGTGKTATVHAVVRELKRMAQQNEANPFNYVEINGLRIPEPAAAYGLLWEAICGHDTATDGHMKISSNQALKLLSRHFSAGERAGPGGHACVVLMDELDQLMTSKQDVVYNFFNWPTLVGSKLVVIAVANTMDLPERVMTGRVRSRLGMIRINFQPYTTPQLEKIVHARLLSAKEGLPSDAPDVIAPDGVKFAAMKISSISGDARRVLDICRRTVELVQPHSRTARTDDVKNVIKDMQNSPTAAYLRDLSFHERLILAALLKCIKKEGIEEIKWGDVQQQHIIYMNLLVGDDDPGRRPTPAEQRMVLDSLLASRAMIHEDGATAGRKPESERRVALNLEHSEVQRVLGEVGGTKWKNALGL